MKLKSLFLLISVLFIGIIGARVIGGHLMPLTSPGIQNFENFYFEVMKQRIFYKRFFHGFFFFWIVAFPLFMLSRDSLFGFLRRTVIGLMVIWLFLYITFPPHHKYEMFQRVVALIDYLIIPISTVSIAFLFPCVTLPVLMISCVISVCFFFVLFEFLTFWPLKILIEYLVGMALFLIAWKKGTSNQRGASITA